MTPYIKIVVTGPVTINTLDDDQLHRLEEKIDHEMWLMRKVLEATVTDPAKLAEVLRRADALTANINKALKAAAVPEAPIST